MPNTPLTNSRIPDLTYAADLAQIVSNAIRDIEDNTTPAFATIAARDAAFASWVSAGNTMRNGLRCFVDPQVSPVLPGREMVYRGGEWTGVQPIYYSGAITAGSRADGVAYTASQIDIPDPGFKYRLAVSASLLVTQNIADARLDLKIYTPTGTVVSTVTKGSKVINEPYSIDHPTRLLPAAGVTAYTGARSIYLRLDRTPAGATSAYAVSDDPLVNHFTVALVPA